MPSRPSSLALVPFVSRSGVASPPAMISATGIADSVIGVDSHASDKLTTGPFSGSGASSSDENSFVPNGNCCNLISSQSGSAANYADAILVPDSIRTLKDGVPVFQPNSFSDPPSPSARNNSEVNFSAVGPDGLHQVTSKLGHPVCSSISDSCTSPALLQDHCDFPLASSSDSPASALEIAPAMNKPRLGYSFCYSGPIPDSSSSSSSCFVPGFPPRNSRGGGGPGIRGSVWCA